MIDGKAPTVKRGRGRGWRRRGVALRRVVAQTPRAWVTTTINTRNITLRRYGRCRMIR